MTARRRFGMLAGESHRKIIDIFRTSFVFEINYNVIGRMESNVLSLTSAQMEKIDIAALSEPSGFSYISEILDGNFLVHFDSALELLQAICEL